jgi:hypothetical protein
VNLHLRLLHAATKRHNWRVHPGYTFHGTAYTAFQVCAGCGTFQPIVLPPGHPESLVEELTREEEDLLGAIADELWPDVADREMADAVRHNVFGDDGSDAQ